ncbi:MAG TPA: NAD-dependent epimerase/dehydratase family protein [Steroidobacteraceae bacterium]|nr:NAD-dependent epimerase/dehydratase family protein [Steroidobacteraceae bacterium]
MQVFLTSATGYVGSAVAARLKARGHAVAALARSKRSLERLDAAGIRPVPGELARPETYRDQAARADVVVHTAFEYSQDGKENLELDRCAVRELLRGRRLIYTSNGYWPAPRHEAEQMVFAGQEHSSNTIVRLGMVYGGHAGGTVSTLFAAARQRGRLPYLAACADNRWSLIHLRDLASLYARLVETPARGVFDAVDNHPLSVRRTLERMASVCGASASAESESAVADMHDPHTIEVMKRDVALDPTRARELDWSPRYSSFDDGAAPAYAEWCAQ